MEVGASKRGDKPTPATVSILLHSGLPLEEFISIFFNYQFKQVSILLHSGLPLEVTGFSSLFYLSHAVSILLHSGLPLEVGRTDLPVQDRRMFQSYFIQDYRWKTCSGSSYPAKIYVSILLHSGLPLEGSGYDSHTFSNWCFNPTSFRITVGSGQMFLFRDRVVLCFNPTSFRITVGRLAGIWGNRIWGLVSILLHSGLPLEGPGSIGRGQKGDEFQSYFIQDYRWKCARYSCRFNPGYCFNPTSFRITVGRMTGWGAWIRSVRFQSYFIQDYRWKTVAGTTSFRNTRCFNPTSFRITVGRGIVTGYFAAFNSFQSYFIQDYRWKYVFS